MADREVFQIDSKVLWVDPKSIMTCGKWFPWETTLERRRQRVVDGDWDAPREKPTGLERFYDSWKLHLDGMNLDDTEYGKEYQVLYPQHRGPTWARLKNQWEVMWKDMQDYGYRWRPYRAGSLDEFIIVEVGRNGDLFFHNGVHRLCFCVMLDVEKVPIKVIIRHKQWQDLRDTIEAYAAKHGGLIYAPIDHVDLAEYRTIWNDWRLEQIRSSVSPSSKTVLDLGAHWGNIAFGLHGDGRTSTAVESVPMHAAMLKRLIPVMKKDIRVVQEELSSFISRENKFDTVIALNIFHHFLKTPEKYAKLCSLLGKLDGNEMFLMSSNPSESQMSEAFKNMDQEEFAFFVSEQSCFKRIHYLGAQGGRKLFKLTKGAK